MPTAVEWRIQGVYAQGQEGLFMVRAKVPGGTLASGQAAALAGLAERLADGTLHLTTRMSVEFHGVREPDLPELTTALRAEGLTSRGACGGAVRGVAVSTTFGTGFAEAAGLARRLHDHFTGNAEFEGLPKKFKIGVDGGYAGARHRIQDLGLVWVGSDAGCDRWDAWVAGGLGRAPTPAFRLAAAVPDREILPLAEAVLRVYRSRCPAGKRLKHLAAQVGREELAALVGAEWGRPMPLPGDGTAPPPAPTPPESLILVRVFAGQLEAGALRSLAGVAEQHAAGALVLTPDQDVGLRLGASTDRPAALEALRRAGLGGRGIEDQVAMRVCPGSHECRLGLAPTRDVARAILASLGPAGARLTWAVSGCPNSCAQPQLADVGVVCTRQTKEAAGELQPLFDLLQASGAAFAEPVRQRLPLGDLLDAIRALW